MSAQIEKIYTTFIDHPLFDEPPLSHKDALLGGPTIYLDESRRLAALFRCSPDAVLRGMLAAEQMDRIYGQNGMDMPPTHQKTLFCYYLSQIVGVNWSKIAHGVNETPQDTNSVIAELMHPTDVGWIQEKKLYLGIVNNPEHTDHDIPLLHRRISKALQQGKKITIDSINNLNVTDLDYEVARSHFIIQAQLMTDRDELITQLQLLGLSDSELLMSLPMRPIPVPKRFSRRLIALAENGYTTEQIASSLGTNKTTLNAIRSHLVATGELATERARNNPVAEQFIPREAIRLTAQIKRLKWQNVPDEEIKQRLGIPSWFLVGAIRRLKFDGHLDYVEFDHQRMKRLEYDQKVTEILECRSGGTRLTIPQIAQRTGVSERVVRELMFVKAAEGAVPRAREKGRNYQELTDDLENVDPNDFKAVRTVLERVNVNYYQESRAMENAPLRSLEKVLMPYFTVKPHGLAPFIAVLAHVLPPNFAPSVKLGPEAIGIPVRRLPRSVDKRTGKLYSYFCVHREHVNIIIDACFASSNLTNYKRDIPLETPE